MRYLVMCLFVGLFVAGCEAAKCSSDDDCISTRFCQFPYGECGGRACA